MFDPRSDMKIVDERGCVECPFYKRKVSAEENCAGCPYNNQETELGDLVRKGFPSLTGVSFECRFMEGDPQPTIKRVDKAYHPESQPMIQKRSTVAVSTRVKDELEGIALDYVVIDPAENIR